MDVTKSLILMLVLACAASADTISDINLAVGEDGFTSVEQRIIFDTPGDYGLTVILPYALDVSVSDSGGNLTHQKVVIDGIEAVKLQFSQPLEAGKTKEVVVRYGTHYLTTKEAETWTFSYQAPTTPRKTIIRATFPQGSKNITLASPTMLFTPVENGIWIYPQEDSINMTISYQFRGAKTPVTTTTLPAKTPFSLDIRLLYGVGLLLIALTVIAIVFTLYRNRLFLKGKGSHMTVNMPEEVVDEHKVVDGSISYNIDGTTEPRGARRVKESVLKVLEENESTIVRILENADEDEVTQAYIYKTTGIPKSSLSDILRQMEKRNVIERRGDGRLKWIKLKSWVLE